MQTLYYTPASTSLALVPESRGSEAYWSNITSLVTSASLYQIVAFSGSTPIAYFPINNTNVILPPFPAAVSTIAEPPVTAGTLSYLITSNYYSGSTSDYYLKDSTSAVTYLTGSLLYENFGAVSVYSGSFEYYLSASQPTIPPYGLIDYSASVTIKNTNTGFTVVDNRLNAAPTGGYTLNTGSAIYEVTMSLYYFLPT